jgi:hypothetical protein
LAFRAPAWKGIERWRTYGITCGEIEARVMQWASNRLSNHDALGERSAVMGALCANGEELFRAMNQQHIVFSDATSEDLSFRNRFHRDASCQISYRLAVAHIALLTEAPARATRSWARDKGARPGTQPSPE